MVATAHATYQCHRDSEASIKSEPVDWSRSAILEYYRRARMKFAPPHRKLSKTEQVTWRRLQTKTYPHLHLLHKIDKQRYPWECAKAPQDNIHETTTREGWEALLSSSEEAAQRAATLQASRRAHASGALE
ncbi:hypothetical protein HPB49_016049 [Dermacentor silvarum]|uniref:Uncharacterized protein n=1 Tax=Dermacentor silvarum TaxID=543639 RepID=A0ACB8CYC2_DERSI|nr:hypothetical protein HPB49_016049 [Dermacentor silvarum]